MNYPFICQNKNCSQYEKITYVEMKMKDYISNPPFPICNEEMQRDISSMKCGAFVDKTNTFYKRYTN